jgi:hypothetical protein
VSFDIRVALYNVRPSGAKDFLSVGEDLLPLVYMARPLATSLCPCLAPSAVTMLALLPPAYVARPLAPLRHTYLPCPHMPSHAALL